MGLASVGIFVDVRVGVRVRVGTGVDVDVGVGVRVRVGNGVGVDVGVGEGVSVGGGIYCANFVGSGDGLGSSSIDEGCEKLLTSVPKNKIIPPTSTIALNKWRFNGYPFDCHAEHIADIAMSR